MLLYRMQVTFLLGKLQSLQERCLRICLNIHDSNNVNDLPNRAGVAKLDDRREMNVNNFMYHKLGRSGHLVAKKPEVTFKPERKRHHVLLSPSLTMKCLWVVYIILVRFNESAYQQI